MKHLLLLLWMFACPVIYYMGKQTGTHTTVYKQDTVVIPDGTVMRVMIDSADNKMNYIIEKQKR